MASDAVRIYGGYGELHFELKQTDSKVAGGEVDQCLYTTRPVAA